MLQQNAQYKKQLLRSQTQYMKLMYALGWYMKKIVFLPNNKFTATFIRVLGSS